MPHWLDSCWKIPRTTLLFVVVISGAIRRQIEPLWLPESHAEVDAIEQTHDAEV
jgi:hypothetical protein